MKRSLFLFVIAGFATFAWSQGTKSTTPPPASAQSSATSDLTVRGPEAVAAKDPNKVVATVNGKQITAKEANQLLQMIPPDQRKNAPNMEQLFERLYAMTQLADEAQKQHLDQDPSVKSQLELNRENILAQAYMNKLTSSTPSAGPTDPKQYYDSHPDEFDTAKLSGIAISFNPPGTPANAKGPNRTEQEAQAKADDVEKKIKAGADITTLARTESDDQRSAAQGGSLGTLSAGQPGVPTQIKDVVFHKLQPGQVSEPIRLPNAFYIIKLDSRNKETFDQARPSIEQKLTSQKEQAIVKQELDKYKVQVQDPNFFNSTPASSAVKTPSLTNPGANASGTTSTAHK